MLKIEKGIDMPASKRRSEIRIELEGLLPSMKNKDFVFIKRNELSSTSVYSVCRKYNATTNGSGKKAICRGVKNPEGTRVWMT